MGLSPAQLIQLRSQERAQKQSLMAGFANQPTSSGNWANMLSQMGGADDRGRDHGRDGWWRPVVVEGTTLTFTRKE